MIRLRRGRRINVRDVIEAERARPYPALQIGEQLERAVLERVARDAEASDIGPRPRPGAFPPLRTERWVSRLIPRMAAAVFGTLVAYAPFALAGLATALILATGGYLAVRSGALQSVAQYWRSPLVRSNGPAIPGAVEIPPMSAPTPPPTLLPPSRAALQRTTPGHAAGAAGERRTSAALAAPGAEVARTHPVGIDPVILESRLLEQARAALRGGRTEAALNSLADAERLPGATLAEEREALTVLALARSGRTEEARRRMASLAVRFPESFYLTRLRAEVESHDDQPR